MAGTRAAIRYAKAVLSLAQDQKVTDAVNDDMKSIAKSFAENEDLRAILQSPVIKSADKRASLKETFSNTHNITEGLLNILVDNKRIGILGAVAEKYSFLYDQLNGKEVAYVTTAVPLSGELEKKVLAKVKDLTGNEVSIENKIDESIIGGFILRVGDLQYNASIANKLSSLKREFINN
ncbi:ATP synthase F1 subunit delta [Leptobacterium flavescens]|uniref:ATP synthase subunit delta n=1 Tax=Leptobacterium flavescens TaxID=472055 RepID=A0A6P0UMZ3_9FLAO|nr:ATP synthase F1 subunit delta [Leptobacterium flavescens]NER13219.1 ATP synthase F1 subunit delta [Leptobacterium flavescens]